MSAVQLRPYQHEALTALARAWALGRRRLAIVLPTGAGKTVIFSELAARCRGRVLVIAHRTELLAQAQQKLRAALGAEVDAVAIEQGESQADTSSRVVVASIRSLSSERIERLTRASPFELVIYDECHHAAAQDNLRVLRELGCFDERQQVKLLGMTATPKRGDGQGLDKIFEDIVYHRTLPEMIADGYLRPLRGFCVATGTALVDEAGNTEDWDDDDLATMIDVDQRNHLVARSIIELARDRRTIAFCATVAHAENLARALNYQGLRSGMICGIMPAQARSSVLSRFAAGEIRVLTNVGVLTEGFDDPGVSCVAMVRPTRSESFYIQCVGRAMRQDGVVRDCLVLDFVDVAKLPLVTLASLHGLPRRLNLEGELAQEAASFRGNSFFDWSDVGDDELVTLAEIQQRASAFDPLTQTVQPEIRAISRFAWYSLGVDGLCIVVQAPSRKRLIRYDVVRESARAQSRWKVRLDGKQVASFSAVEQAVEAVDYEIEKLGPTVVASAFTGAPWRNLPTPAPVREEVAAASHGRANPQRLEDAMHLLALLEHRGRRPR